MEPDRRPSSRRLVVKVGSGVLTQGDSGIDVAVLRSLAAQCAEAVAGGRRLVVVSSGAIALGMRQFGLAARPRRTAALQACAAAGQGQLIRLWSEAFAAHDRVVAQVLLTHADLADRARFLNAGRCLAELQSRGAVPVVNENDTVAIEELTFGDNDALSAQVANLADADLLVMLSVAPGLLDGRRRIPRVRYGDRTVDRFVRGDKSRGGTGGMLTKIAAARSAAARGITAVICEGKAPRILSRVLAGDDVGTTFAPATKAIASRGHWIAHTLRPKGTLVVDRGAARALLERHGSLLPSGVLSVVGSFARGDSVGLEDIDGKPFARGLSTYASTELEAIRGRRSSEILGVLGLHLGDEAVHRDQLVLLSDSA